MSALSNFFKKKSDDNNEEEKNPEEVRIGHVLQIAARAEMLAGAAQDDGADLRIGGCGLERCAELPRHGHVHGVARLGPVKCDGQVKSTLIERQVLAFGETLRHAALPCDVCSRSGVKRELATDLGR